MKRFFSLALVGLVPLAIFLIGFAAAGHYGFREIPALFIETARGMVPDGFSTELAEVGTYTVWLHARGREGGEFHRGAEQLPPGARIFLFDKASGQEIEYEQWIDSKKYLGHEKAISLGSFQSRREAQLVEVRGTGFRVPVLISISPANASAVLKVVLTLVAIIMAALAFAVVALVLLVRRRQKRVAGGSSISS